MLVDRFHVLQHKCKKQNDCDNQPELTDINTQVCEQTNFLINKFKHISKNMSKEHYNLFYLNYFNELNKRNFD